jgi:hypothetical protein
VDAGLAGHEVDVEGAVHREGIVAPGQRVFKCKCQRREISHIRSK